MERNKTFQEKINELVEKTQEALDNWTCNLNWEIDVRLKKIYQAYLDALAIMVELTPKEAEQHFMR